MRGGAVLVRAASEVYRSSMTAQASDARDLVTPGYNSVLARTCRETSRAWTRSSAPIHSPGLRALQDQAFAAAEAVAKEFARLNGWLLSARPFSLRRLAGIRQRRAWVSDSGEEAVGHEFDHAEFFKRDRRPAAIVVHNYGGPPPAVPGLRLVRLPWSWYYPGRTTAYCLVPASEGA